ncbi:hypothetical protein [Bradyrhizobium sp. NAS80.1]|uniref:hypothetical protein n=1 Tax=Bradyrhizobium sp. NAS80.1 TaxID=1680159 RepID=UPI00143D68A4|nr:hypothetical protein [Bradyrhizobium sp. NAS80.1]
MSTLDVAAGVIRRDETVEVVLAFHFVQPLVALALGIVVAAWLWRATSLHREMVQ